jgi:patatin-like phospholipase/acyl hydrolase
MADSKNRLVIPAYNLDDNDVYLLKTPHHKRLTRDYRVPMWKVGMATSAAPTYFPAFREIDSIRLIDGGVWANNPAMVGIVEATSMLNIPLGAIKVLSIGTFEEVTNCHKRLNHGGLWQWRTTAIDVALRGQSVGAIIQAQHLLGKDKVYRLNPKVPPGLFAMDKVSTEGLLSKAGHHSRVFSPTFDQEFRAHVAPVFTPIHS